MIFFHCSGTAPQIRILLRLYTSVHSEGRFLPDYQQIIKSTQLSLGLSDAFLKFQNDSIVLSKFLSFGFLMLEALKVGIYFWTASILFQGNWLQ